MPPACSASKPVICTAGITFPEDTPGSISPPAHEQWKAIFASVERQQLPAAESSLSLQELRPHSGHFSGSKNGHGLSNRALHTRMLSTAGVHGRLRQFVMGGEVLGVVVLVAAVGLWRTHRP